MYCGRSSCAWTNLIAIQKARKPTPPLNWQCSSECKPITKTEVDAIVDLRESFDKPMVSKCDAGCPNQHYTKVIPRPFEQSGFHLGGGGGGHSPPLGRSSPPLGT